MNVTNILLSCIALLLLLQVWEQYRVRAWLDPRIRGFKKRWIRRIKSVFSKS